MPRSSASFEESFGFLKDLSSLKFPGWFLWEIIELIPPLLLPAGVPGLPCNLILIKPPLRDAALMCHWSGSISKLVLLRFTVDIVNNFLNALSGIVNLPFSQSFSVLDEVFKKAATSLRDLFLYASQNNKSLFRESET